MLAAKAPKAVFPAAVLGAGIVPEYAEVIPFLAVPIKKLMQFAEAIAVQT